MCKTNTLKYTKKETNKKKKKKKMQGENILDFFVRRRKNETYSDEAHDDTFGM